MYNLLMTAANDAWNNPTYAIDRDRFLEYTDSAIAARYKLLSDDAIAELIGLPALFAYERFLGQAARVGRITHIQRRNINLGLTFAFDPDIKPIPLTTLEGLYGGLDIDPKSEGNRTHWAVKDVDLAAVLRSANILASADIADRPRPPRVFISYSWDSPEHKVWVAQLGGYLRQNGIDVLLDQWHVGYGEDLAAFMERAVQEADRVLVICTESYVQRASGRTGGAGYELTMVTSELIRNANTAKFLPVVLQANPTPKLPAALATRRYFDLSSGPNYNEQMLSLVRELHNIKIPLPPLGKNPFKP